MISVGDMIEWRRNGRLQYATIHEDGQPKRYPYRGVVVGLPTNNDQRLLVRWPWQPERAGPGSLTIPSATVVGKSYYCAGCGGRAIDDYLCEECRR